MIKNIRHLIFDLGGVILNVDYNLTERAFIEAGIPDFPQMFSQRSQNSFFDNWEMGKVTAGEFISEMKKDAAKPISDDDVIKCWDAMLLDFPLRRLQLLQQLRLHYDVFLLSNTNAIHERGFNKILLDSHGIPNIGAFFDKVYLSHHMGMRKPMPEIYQLVLDENNLKPEHTLFIDDSKKNTDGAAVSGVQVIHLEKGMTIEKDIFRPKEGTI